jgi:hypothetical protein
VKVSMLLLTALLLISPVSALEYPDFPEKPDIPEQEGDDTTVEVTVRQMRFANWYFEAYGIAREYSFNLTDQFNDAMEELNNCAEDAGDIEKAMKALKIQKNIAVGFAIGVPVVVAIVEAVLWGIRIGKQ